MKIGRKLINGSNRKYTFEYDKEIFVITYKHLVNTDKIEEIKKNGFTKDNLPLPLLNYAAGRYSVLFLTSDDKIEFIYNPKNYSLIKDISKEFYKFITENYEKL